MKYKIISRDVIVIVLLLLSLLLLPLFWKDNRLNPVTTGLEYLMFYIFVGYTDGRVNE